MKRQIKNGNGYAWVYAGQVCHWAKPSKASLTQDHKPSPESEMVWVASVPMREYRRLRRIEREAARAGEGA